jgi:preprotein translocase subunit SecA
MAGRGTDIVLGDGVIERGGLHIIGTERHESRRIDNQLRGRAGRQGDPGSSRFYISLEDDLMRLFGGARIKSVMTRLGMPDNEPIEHGLITRSIERAQKKVEDYHFGIRKQVLKYDDVMNRQRETIYALRKTILVEDSISDKISEFINNISSNIFNSAIINKNDLDNELIISQLKELIPENIDYQLPSSFSLESIQMLLEKAYHEKRSEHPSEIFDQIEKIIILRNLDTKWIDHLHNMDILREGIGLRAYGQKDPLIEYKIEGFNMFQELLADIERETLSLLYRVEIMSEDDLPEEDLLENPANLNSLNYQAPELVSQLSAPSPMAQQSHGRAAEKKLKPIVNSQKIGRNDPCLCGSGKKYKHCCGK